MRVVFLIKACGRYLTAVLCPSFRLFICHIVGRIHSIRQNIIKLFIITVAHLWVYYFTLVVLKIVMIWPNKNKNNKPEIESHTAAVSALTISNFLSSH